MKLSKAIRREMEMSERREHKRFPVLYHLVRPVMVRTSEHSNVQMPATMANLSAGGMALVTFEPIPIGTKIDLNFDLAGLKARNTKARVAWSRNNSGAYALGLQFIKLPRPLFNRINKLADDFDACETRVLLGDRPICKRGCSYYEHCTKLAKGHYDK